MTFNASYTPVPEKLREWVDAHPRASAITEHGFDLNVGWWNERLSDVPGGPIMGSGGETTHGRISRGSLFDMGDAALKDESGDSALRLLWHTLAWGSGSNHRNSPRRIAAIAALPASGILLKQVAEMSSSDPKSTFLLMQPRGNAVKYLGPNFFTKFMYFAGGGAADHACLIVDNRVLRTLDRVTGQKEFSPGTTNYGWKTYVAALEQMKSWSEKLSTGSRTVGPDEVERWAFAAQ
jgi:hypothetical protein